MWSEASWVFSDMLVSDAEKHGVVQSGPHRAWSWALNSMPGFCQGIWLRVSGRTLHAVHMLQSSPARG